MPENIITNPEYFRSYGLERDPFPVGSVDAVYYATPELEHRLELVKHLTDFSDRILLLMGAEGAGKTAFLKRLKTEADERWKITELAVTGNETPQDVISTIYAQNSLEYHPEESVQSSIGQLGRHFKNNSNNNLVNVLLVDDAHLLTASVLNLLLQFARPGASGMPLHLVLMSVEDISSLFINQDNEFLHKMDIPALTEDQVRLYLQYRIGETESDQIKIFAADQIKQIYKTSGGLPALVNQLAARVLQDPSRTGTVKPKSETPSLVRLLLNGRVTLIASLVLVCVFVVIALNQETTNEKEVIDISLPKPESETIPAPVVNAETMTPPDSTAPEIAVLRDADTEPPEAGVVAEKPVLAETIQESDKLTEAREQTITTQPEPPAQPVSAAKAPAAEPETRLVISRTEPEPVPEPPQPPATGTTKPATEQPAGLKGVSWIKQQKADYYVLQLMGAYDPEVLTRLLSANPSIYDQVARFTTVNNNKRWHVLVYGLFPDHDTAVKNIQQLPKNLQALGPWPRSVASIQKDLE